MLPEQRHSHLTDPNRSLRGGTGQGAGLAAPRHVPIKPPRTSPTDTFQSPKGDSGFSSNFLAQVGGRDRGGQGRRGCSCRCLSPDQALSIDTNTSLPSLGL